MKILVRGTNWIGDAVMSIPALRELRRVFPDAKITLHTRAWADGLFQDASFIDELVTFEKNRFAVKDVYDNSQFLKEDAYDLAILLPNSFESAVTSFFSKIPRRMGYNKDLRGLLLTDPIAVPEWKNRKHEVFYYLNLVGEVERRVLGRDTVGQQIPEGRLDVSEDRRKAAVDLMSKRGVDLRKTTIAFVAGSANSPEKRWRPENFARVGALFRAERSANILLLGSKNETDVSDAIKRIASFPVADLTGQTSLGEAAAILSTVDLVISNDTGLAHVAPAVATRTVVIFGPTNPETTRPYSPLAHIIQGRSRGEWPSVDEVLNLAVTKLEEDVIDETAGNIS